MRILWVKTAGLVPPDTGGKIRSYNILRQLARRHSVTLFTFYAAHDNDMHPALEGVFERVVAMPMQLPAPKSFGELCEYMRLAFSLEPYNITKYCRANVRQALRRILEQEAYDVIVCDFVFAAGVIPWDWPCAKVLFAHNVESTIWRRHYDVARNPLWKLLAWREWRTMARAEKRYLRRAQRVVTVSDADTEHFQRFLEHGVVSSIPTGVDTEYFTPADVPQAPASIVFTGSMDWLPNEDAVWYFAQEILPLIRRSVPEATLDVVGRNPSSRLRALAARESAIRVTGWVEDIRPYLARSCVCAVPLRIGGGTRIKIYEAMAMGKPVVSTSIGAEGLPIADGLHAIVADGPQAFADAVTSLLRDAERRRRLGQAARAFVCESYSWTNVASAFAGILASARTRPGVRQTEYPARLHRGA